MERLGTPFYEVLHAVSSEKGTYGQLYLFQYFQRRECKPPRGGWKPIDRHAASLADLERIESGWLRYATVANRQSSYQQG